MEIRTAQPGDLGQIYSFNERMYPEKSDSRHLIDFWYSKSKDEINNTVLMMDNSTLVGQCFFIGMKYYLDGKSVDTVWGFDLIVEERLRKSGQGADLMLFCLDRFPSYAATGVGPDAMPLHKKLGRKELGKLRKYVGIGNPLYFVSALFKGVVPVSKFPAEVVTDNSSLFLRINADELPELSAAFNTDLLEISRDKDFLKWRFWGGLHEYAFYLNRETSEYFVLRTIVKNHITALVLVDYRCDAGGRDAFDSILSAVRTAAKQLRLPVVICGSSLAVFDSVLEAKGFRSVGYERPIIGKVKLGDRKESVENRKFIFVTLADSDGEVLW